MSDLKIYRGAEREPVLQTQNSAEIQVQMSSLGAIFEQHDLLASGSHIDASQDEIIEAHRELLNSLMLQHAFATIDVLNINAQFPCLEKLQRQFQTEHKHPEVEARLFIAGRGCFYMRAEAEVYAITCETGDFISLPSDVSHWFDMDTATPLCTVRLYSSSQGWHAIPTGEDMQGAYPSLFTEACKH